jgi:hypothetical protein
MPDQYNKSVLLRFQAQAIKLEDEKFSQLEKQRVSMSFMSNGKEFGNVTSELPSNDLLRLFLIDFRFFYIKDKNPHNFEAVCNFFISENFKTDEVQSWLDVYHRVFKDDSIDIRIDQKQLTTKMLFETILNAETFHQEGSQRGVQLMMASPFIEPIARMKFFDLITKLRGIICSFNRQVVEKYIAENIKI